MAFIFIYITLASDGAKLHELYSKQVTLSLLPPVTISTWVNNKCTNISPHSNNAQELLQASVNISTQLPVNTPQDIGAESMFGAKWVRIPDKW